jgi:23S rRNA G2445 N2-methylase RlmL
MKVLYESVIAADERHRRGEYYTSDWLADELADEIVLATVTKLLDQRVLDPGCGSCTFLF